MKPKISRIPMQGNRRRIVRPHVYGSTKSSSLKEIAAEKLIALSEKGWPEIETNHSLSSLSKILAEKKLTPYKNEMSIRKVVQELLDKDKITLP